LDLRFCAKLFGGLSLKNESQPVAKVINYTFRLSHREKERHLIRPHLIITRLCFLCLSYFVCRIGAVLLECIGLYS